MMINQLKKREEKWDSRFVVDKMDDYKKHNIVIR